MMKESKTCLKHMVSYCYSYLAMINQFLLFPICEPGKGA